MEDPITSGTYLFLSKETKKDRTRMLTGLKGILVMLETVQWGKFGDLC